MKITDEQAASARRMRLGKRPYTWSQIAEHLNVPLLDLIRRCDRTQAKTLGLMNGRQGAKEKFVRTREKVYQPISSVREYAGGMRTELAELLYEIFDEILFADRAVFERQPSLRDEFKSARKKGQTITGFLMGDPLPGRSALDQKRQSSIDAASPANGMV